MPNPQPVFIAYAATISIYEGLRLTLIRIEKYFGSAVAKRVEASLQHILAAMKQFENIRTQQSAKKKLWSAMMTIPESTPTMLVDVLIFFALRRYRSVRGDQARSMKVYGEQAINDLEQELRNRGVALPAIPSHTWKSTPAPSTNGLPPSAFQGLLSVPKPDIVLKSVSEPLAVTTPPVVPTPAFDPLDEEMFNHLEKNGFNPDKVFNRLIRAVDRAKNDGKMSP